jgi:hypothetical protein
MATVLFVCKANRGRSVMCQALFEHAAGGRHRAISAGSEAIPTAARTPKWSRLCARSAAVVTMGCGDACPVIPRPQGTEVLDCPVDELLEDRWKGEANEGPNGAP